MGRAKREEPFLAQALFANVAEYPDELAFDKGQKLVVLSRKPDIEGINDGWWLCATEKGQKGIVPANRLRKMMPGEPFDRKFFQVASPLMDDFFVFNQSSPFDDPFFRDRSVFSTSLRDRLTDVVPVRRLNSYDDALKIPTTTNNVRNIPIRVQNAGTERHTHSQMNLNEVPSRQERRFSEMPQMRRTVSSGRVSPPTLLEERVEAPLPPQRRHFVSSDEEERRSENGGRKPQRTLVIPSSIPGQNIEIILDSGVDESRLQPIPPPRKRSKSPKPESQLERLSQRLKKLANPFRIPAENGRSDSPTSSSGIGADVTDSCHSGEELPQRCSDVSSLSDAQSLLMNDNDDVKLQPPPVTHTPHQPYLSRLTRENTPSTSVLQTVFDQMDRPSRYLREKTPAVVEEDMRRNAMTSWNVVPTRMREAVIGDTLEEEIQSRKRVVCNRMAEAMRNIDNALTQINKATAAKHWRAAHILQSNINSLKDSVWNICESIDRLLECSGRISIDVNTQKAQELAHQVEDIHVDRDLLNSLRRTLDSCGWTVAVLSMDREQLKTMDALEQFVNVVQRIPSSCRRLVQWVQMLVPSSTVIFLSPSSTNNQRLPVNRLSAPTNEHRLSSASNTSGDSTTPSSILITRPSMDKPKGKVTFADESTDRSSTGSSIDNSSVEYSTIQKPKRREDMRVMEEEDLESVHSDGDSLFQDYAYLDDVVPGRSVDKKTVLNDEDRQLVRFYAPQLEQHTEALSTAIEEFLATVENSCPPREFVQKGKLIILAAHKLIYIGDTVSQCIRDKTISIRMRSCADRLCDLLKDCVRATKTAADEYPDIDSMQQMVDSIMSVSRSAHELKMIVKECC